MNKYGAVILTKRGMMAFLLNATNTFAISFFAIIGVMTMIYVEGVRAYGIERAASEQGGDAVALLLAQWQLLPVGPAAIMAIILGVILGYAAAKRTAIIDVPTVESEPSTDAILSLESYALEIHKSVNKKFYGAILSAFQQTASVYGYSFSRAGESAEFEITEKEMIGKAILRTKMKYISPFMDEGDIDAWVNRNTRDGDGISWVEDITRGLKSTGIIFTKSPVKELPINQEDIESALPQH